jgi:hypothetical protein
VGNRYSKRDWPIQLIRRWVELELRTHQWVADQLGCANQTIAKLCKKHGIRTQRTGPRAGPGHPEWKGGRAIDKDGYVIVFCPHHPHARKHTRYMFEHRLVMEQKLGRYLSPNEVVHHKNRNKQDNRPENLELFQSNAAHLKHELTGKCPNWTPEGKRRMLLGGKRWRATRRALKPDVPQTPQTIHLSKA